MEGTGSILVSPPRWGGGQNLKFRQEVGGIAKNVPPTMGGMSPPNFPPTISKSGLHGGDRGKCVPPTMGGMGHYDLTVLHGTRI